MLRFIALISFVATTMAGGCDRATTPGPGNEPKDGVKTEAPAPTQTIAGAKQTDEPTKTAEAKDADQTIPPEPTAETTKTSDQTAPSSSTEPEDPAEAEPAEPPKGEPPPAGTPEEGSGRPMEAIMLVGPFESIDAVCRSANDSVDSWKDCEPVNINPMFAAKIELPPSVVDFAFREIGNVARTVVEDVFCVVALKTTKGWFHHTWHCQGTDEREWVETMTTFYGTKSEDLIRKGAPELVARFSKSVTKEGAEDHQGHSLVCDATDPAAPWCVFLTTQQTIDYDYDSETFDEFWTLKIVPTAEGFALEPAEGELPDRVKKTLGPYFVKTPSRRAPGRPLGPAPAPAPP